MIQSVSRREWFRDITAGMTGLLASERLVRGAQGPAPASGALVDPRSAIKITKLEIIPVNSLRTPTPASSASVKGRWKDASGRSSPRSRSSSRT
jgi:hypothetical protein